MEDYKETILEPRFSQYLDENPDVDEVAFMKNHEEIVTARLSQYLDKNPDVDEVPSEVADQLVEECFLEHEIVRFKSTENFDAKIKIGARNTN